MYQMQEMYKRWEVEEEEKKKKEKEKWMVGRNNEKC